MDVMLAEIQNPPNERCRDHDQRSVPRVRSSNLRVIRAATRPHRHMSTSYPLSLPPSTSYPLIPATLDLIPPHPCPPRSFHNYLFYFDKFRRVRVMRAGMGEVFNIGYAGRTKARPDRPVTLDKIVRYEGGKMVVINEDGHPANVVHQARHLCACTSNGVQEKMRSGGRGGGVFQGGLEGQVVGEDKGYPAAMLNESRARTRLQGRIPRGASHHISLVDGLRVPSTIGSCGSSSKCTIAGTASTGRRKLASNRIPEARVAARRTSRKRRVGRVRAARVLEDDVCGVEPRANTVLLDAARHMRTRQLRGNAHGKKRQRHVTQGKVRVTEARYS